MQFKHWDFRKLHTDRLILQFLINDVLYHVKISQSFLFLQLLDVSENNQLKAKHKS